MVSKYAGDYVDIILTGDAGDEIFAGYSKYLIGYYSDRYNKIPKWGRDIFRKAIYFMPDNTSITRKIRKVIENSNNDVFTQRKNLMCLGFKEYELPLLLHDNYMENDNLDIITDYYNSQLNAEDELSRALYNDYKIVLEGDMLAKVGIASRLTSLDTRAPLLYKEVVELAARIPNRYKISAKNTKIILKDTFKDLIPKQLYAASKRGFGVPIDNWFRVELKDDLLNELDKNQIIEQGIFKYEYIKRILTEHFNMTRNRSSELWVLYIFQKWYRHSEISSERR
jgi:asparagine synthase (glutamine-hydrolysing)